MLTDSHCHIWWDSFDDDRAAMFARAREAGVGRMIVVATDPATALKGLELADTSPVEGVELHATAGLHPHDAERFGAETRAEIRRLCMRDDVVAVGETGLDWFKEWAPREAQLASFRWHLELARELDKPVIVHCRDAHEDTARLIGEVPGVRGVMHCYTMGVEELPPYLDAGFHISFSGVVTYPKNGDNRAAAREVPLDRLLVETDAPFLAPVPHRGKRNEPAFVREVLARVAEERGTDVDDLTRRTSDNAAELFGLAPLTVA